MAWKPLTRTNLSLALIAALACLTMGVVSVPHAAATTYSFKPARADHGTVLFVVKSVRPASVRAGRVRAGNRKYSLDLATARKAARRGQLRLPVAAVIGANAGSVSPNGDRMTFARRHGRLKIVVDTTPPETAIASGPSGTVTSQTASFAISSADSTAKFQCQIDSGGWSNCESPKTYTGLTAGTHTFLVRAYDPAGNLDAIPADRTWTVELQPPPTPEPSPEPAPTGGLLVDEFAAANGPNNLITNEYAGWHSSDSTAVQSSVWRSDGGSLFSVSAIDASGATSRVAYTGNLDNNAADRYSQTYTHSSKMRFWTDATGYGDVRIDAKIKATSWSPEAPSSWGGFKFYLHREVGATESPFYTVEPFIKDGHLYIQKKCLGDTGGGNYSTGGTYYVLASKSGFDVPLGSWQKIAATAHTNSDGSVTIGLYRNDELLLQAVDRGVRSDGTGCEPLGAGHVGFRSDFLQYYLDDFKVTPQS